MKEKERIPWSQKRHIRTGMQIRHVWWSEGYAPVRRIQRKLEKKWVLFQSIRDCRRAELSRSTIMNIRAGLWKCIKTQWEHCRWRKNNDSHIVHCLGSLSLRLSDHKRRTPQRISFGAGYIGAYAERDHTVYGRGIRQRWFPLDLWGQSGGIYKRIDQARTERIKNRQFSPRHSFKKDMVADSEMW